MPCTHILDLLWDLKPSSAWHLWQCMCTAIHPHLPGVSDSSSISANSSAAPAIHLPIPHQPSPSTSSRFNPWSFWMQTDYQPRHQQLHVWTCFLLAVPTTTSAVAHVWGGFDRPPCRWAWQFSEANEAWCCGVRNACPCTGRSFACSQWVESHQGWLRQWVILPGLVHQLPILFINSSRPATSALKAWCWSGSWCHVCLRWRGRRHTGITAAICNFSTQYGAHLKMCIPTYPLERNRKPSQGVSNAAAYDTPSWGSGWCQTAGDCCLFSSQITLPLQGLWDHSNGPPCIVLACPSAEPDQLPWMQSHHGASPWKMCAAVGTARPNCADGESCGLI